MVCVCVFFFIGGISGIWLFKVPRCSQLCFCWLCARQGCNNTWSQSDWGIIAHKWGEQEMGKRTIMVEFTMLLYLMLRFIWDSEGNWWIYVYLYNGESETDMRVVLTHLWTVFLSGTAIRRPFHRQAVLFRSNVTPEISWWNRVWFQELSRSLSAAEPLKGANVMAASAIQPPTKWWHSKCGRLFILSDKPLRETLHSQREQRRRRSQWNQFCRPCWRCQRLLRNWKPVTETLFSHRFISKKLKASGLIPVLIWEMAASTWSGWRGVCGLFVINAATL